MALLTDTFLKNILTTTKTIAMVGLSMNETRPSYFVGDIFICEATRSYRLMLDMEGKISLAKRLYRALKKSTNP